MARTIQVIGPSGLSNPVLSLVNMTTGSVVENVTLSPLSANAAGVYRGTLTAVGGTYIPVLLDGSVQLGAFERIEIEGDDPEEAFVRETTNPSPMAAQIIAEALFTEVMQEDYSALGENPTLSQILFEVRQLLIQHEIVNDEWNVKKMDAVTNAMVLKFDQVPNPTSVRRIQ